MMMGWYAMAQYWWHGPHPDEEVEPVMCFRYDLDSPLLSEEWFDLTVEDP
jgi:hypothetical protein